MQPVRWRLHVLGVVVEELAAGRLSLLEAAAWERALDPYPRDNVERYCSSMLQNLAILVSIRGSQEDVEALRRGQDEFACLLAGGPLELPDPPEIHGLPPKPEKP